ncbi:MAG TPA: thioredoxin domain-containing protein [Candidatus Dormibacteraeota bacterium]
MSNRLAGETSPYLLQHADNPVDWYPWGDEAFARARAEDRPVLLSIGYSACHWCHVMAHECFENAEIAKLINERFISIKVDREERPDVDSIYMQAVIAISGHGGWPMTVFLTPSGEPYFGGTYFPPVDRQGLRGFPYVLDAAATVYRERRDEVTQAADQLRRALEPPALPAGAGSTADLGAAAAQLVAQTDMRHGGFGAAPKFPHPAALDFLLRRHRTSSDARLLDAALISLDHMARGGIHDQVGGGFHRYSVDGLWSIPHFEKMLYDNAQLAPVYLHAHQLTGDRRWRAVVEDTLDHALRELRLPGGGFASSQDADSPGGEGSYFVWTPSQLTEALGDDDGTLAARVFGVSDAGNFEERTTVLSMPFPLTQVARSLGTSEDALAERVESIRERLLAARQQRPAPARDDKVLTSWNALMLAALAEAGAALARPDYVNAARRCADFLLSELRRDGVLLRTWKDGRAKITGFLEDSAFLADSLITLYEACGDGRYLDAARQLVDDALRRFEDGGVLYDTASDAEPLLVRPRTIDDNPIPAGQSVLAAALLRIAAIDGDAAARHDAETIIGPFTAVAARSPLAITSLACAMDRAQTRSREIAIVGPAADPRTLALLAVVRRQWLPDSVLAWGDSDNALLADRAMVDGAPAAYVCENFACQRPVTEPEQLAEALAAVAAPA